MTDTGVLLRCKSCKTVNRIPVSRLSAHPICGKCKARIEFPAAPVDVSDAAFRQEVLDHPGAVLVFFWATWCAHCRGMFPLLDDIARRMAGILKIARVNTEREVQLARMFSIMSVPRLSFYRHGRLIDEVNGAVPKPQLDQWIASCMERSA